MKRVVCITLLVFFSINANAKICYALNEYTEKMMSVPIPGEFPPDANRKEHLVANMDVNYVLAKPGQPLKIKRTKQITAYIIAKDPQTGKSVYVDPYSVLALFEKTPAMTSFLKERKELRRKRGKRGRAGTGLAISTGLLIGLAGGILFMIPWAAGYHATKRRIVNAWDDAIKTYNRSLQTS